MYYLLILKSPKTVPDKYVRLSQLAFSRTEHLTFEYDAERNADFAIWEFKEQKIKEWMALVHYTLATRKGEYTITQIMLDVERNFPEYIESRDIFYELLNGAFLAVGTFDLYDVYADRKYTVNSTDDVDKIASILSDVRKECFTADVELHQKLQNLENVSEGLKLIAEMPEHYRVINLNGYLNQLKTANQLDQSRADVIISEACTLLSAIKDKKLRNYLTFRFIAWNKRISDGWFPAVSPKLIMTDVLPLIESMNFRYDVTQYVLIRLYVFSNNAAITPAMTELRSYVARIINKIHKIFFLYPEFKALETMRKTANKALAADAYFIASKKYPNRNAIRNQFVRLFGPNDTISDFKLRVVQRIYYKMVPFQKRIKYGIQMLRDNAKNLPFIATTIVPLVAAVIIPLFNMIALIIMLAVRQQTPNLIAYQQAKFPEALALLLIVLVFIVGMGIWFFSVILGTLYSNMIRESKSDAKKKQQIVFAIVAVLFAPILLSLSIFPVVLYASDNVSIGITKDEIFSGFNQYSFNSYNAFQFNVDNHCSTSKSINTASNANCDTDIIFEMHKSSNASDADPDRISFNMIRSSPIYLSSCDMIINLENTVKATGKTVKHTVPYTYFIASKCPQNRVYDARMTIDNSNYILHVTVPFELQYEDKNSSVTFYKDRLPVLVISPASPQTTLSAYYASTSVANPNWKNLSQVTFTDMTTVQYVTDVQMGAYCTSNSIATFKCGYALAKTGNLSLKIVCKANPTTDCMEIMKNMSITKVTE